jgi:hypothetical protein
MAEDPLVKLHADGFYIQRLIETEYDDVHRDQATWLARKEALIGRWRRMARDWAVAVEATLGGDSVSLVRFHNAQASPSVPVGMDIAWAGIRGFVVVRLEVLTRILEGRRSASGAQITIGSIGGPGAVNLGTVHGGMNVSLKVLQESGEGQLAALFAQLLEKLPAARDLLAAQKEEVAELAQGLAEETARRPSGGRLSVMGKAAARMLGEIVTKSADLASIWEAIKQLL